jgi:hypothetical protein
MSFCHIVLGLKTSLVGSKTLNPKPLEEAICLLNPKPYTSLSKSDFNFVLHLFFFSSPLKHKTIWNSTQVEAFLIFELNYFILFFDINNDELLKTISK